MQSKGPNDELLNQGNCVKIDAETLESGRTILEPVLERKVFDGIPECTEQERQDFNELKLLTRQEIPDFDESKEFYSDLTLFHYIKKYQDPIIAFESWKETIEWRREFGVEDILNNYNAGIRLTKPFARQIHKTDKLGRPIGITRISLIDFDLFKQEPDAFLRDLVHEHEKTRTIRMRACSDEKGKVVSQFLNILDLQGATISSLNRGYQLTASVNQIVQKHFPDAMGKMYIINAPWIFYQIWNVAKKLLLEERVVNKIEVLGADYYGELLKVIDAENIPSYLNGNCDCKQGCENVIDLGPWSTVELNDQNSESL